jgi:uncharacterized membrane protein
MRYLLLGLAYVIGMALILAAGFFPAMFLAGPHSGTLSGVPAGLVWMAYGGVILLGPWPAVRWLRRRFAEARKAEAAGENRSSCRT